ncbi:MAG TPA: GNAT family N-acetyltransferase [Thermoanaerobaculia bacterium]|nr:GNAT family N-acetyltransferase [Thermoanaerobaculia bacterium]
MEWERGSLSISTERSRIDRNLVHEFLRDRSYWAAGIPREVVDRSIDEALCFGVYDGDAQVGFARVVTDRATFAYLADVFILESHQGRGIATWLMEVIVGHPDLQGLRRWILMTRDAHGLYEKFGFRRIADPSRCMEIVDREVYRRRPAGRPAP